MYLSMYYVGISRTTLTNALETLAGPNHRPWRPREHATSLSVGSFSTSTLMLAACLSPPFPRQESLGAQSFGVGGGGQVYKAHPLTLILARCGPQFRTEDKLRV